MSKKYTLIKLVGIGSETIIWVINVGTTVKNYCMEYKLKDSVDSPAFYKQQKLQFSESVLSAKLDQRL